MISLEKHGIRSDQLTQPLNDIICFADGTYFAVGKAGTILSNYGIGNRYEWDNSVETKEDHNFHGATGWTDQLVYGPTT